MALNTYVDSIGAIEAVLNMQETAEWSTIVAAAANTFRGGILDPRFRAGDGGANIMCHRTIWRPPISLTSTSIC